MFDDTRGNVAMARVWNVAALVQAVGDALAARFGSCAVRGELSGFSRASSGHCYFNLKDADHGEGLLRCAMFRRAAALLPFTPADGQLVELRGRIGVYGPRGELQFVAEAMQRAGDGALFEKFLRLKAQLQSEGLFDPSRKRVLPAFPRRIGVVTSLGAAALHDVTSTLQRRAPHVELVVYPCLVQGAEAPESICSAIELACRRSEVDTIILCRGGGSLEDLWAFNDAGVVRAVAACRIPLICGVGHESDISLADLAADLRAPTPTAAAELAAPATRECRNTVDALELLLVRRVHEALDAKAQRLDRLSMRLARPADVLRRRAQQLGMLEQRMAATRQRLLERRRLHLAQLQARLVRSAVVMMATQRQRSLAVAARLQALDPTRVLARGYAWLVDDDGRAVLSAGQLQPGDALRAVLADGTAGVVVRDVVRASAQ